jgi:hypothetical protein
VRDLGSLGLCFNSCCTDGLAGNFSMKEVQKIGEWN